MKQEVRPVPLSGPFLDEREEELVVEVMRSGRLSLGPMVDRFEELFAAKVGAPYAAAVSSGTAGLHLLCVAAGIEPGDEVITSPYSFAASANCFVYEGGVPVFADIDARTLNMDPRAVEAAITPRTKAIVAVDIYGYPCEMDELRAIADRHGLVLIDDSCEALGAEYRGAPLGSQGPSAVFAFYPNKQMTTGEGGMVTTHSEKEWRLLRSLRNQGRGDDGGCVRHAELRREELLEAVDRRTERQPPGAHDLHHELFLALVEERPRQRDRTDFLLHALVRLGAYSSHWAQRSLRPCTVSR